METLRKEQRFAEPLSLGPAGQVDLYDGQQCWLLDGPEVFFRPFYGTLRRTPKERCRALLFQRLLADNYARRCVADFFPAAPAKWPVASSLHRVDWLEWGRATPSMRLDLLGLNQD